jgi:glycosyltransferase involved in cell wall biosynthesis
MNHEYIVLAGWWWRLVGKKIILWHAHKSVNWKLRLSEKLVDTIVTSTKSGCRLDSKKIKIVGQGIDISNFQFPPRPELGTKAISNFQKNNDKFKIISVGRISPIKDYGTLINAVEIVQQSGVARNLIVEIVGGAAVPEDEMYLYKLKVIVKEKGLEDIFKFVGSVPNKNIISYLQNANLFINASLTGSLDKAVLEAMACGLPILTCNEAYLNVLGQYQEKLMFPKGDFKKLADKILYLINMKVDEREKMISDLRDIVVKNHSLDKLILNILNYCR